MNPWMIREMGSLVPFNETEIEKHGYWGFVYLIYNTVEDRAYLGKKFFTKAGTKQINGRKKRIRKESDWKTYHGSSTALQEDIEVYGYECFTREILHLCKTKAECTYWESYEIYSRHALIHERYYNDWISCRVRKVHLRPLHFDCPIHLA